MGVAAVLFPADYAFRVLHGDFAHCLRDRDNTGDHTEKKQNHQHQDHRVHLAGLSAARYKRLPRLRQRSRQSRDNADGDNQRNTVADAALSDLIAQPH